jgi:hypothetical protein
MNWLLGTLGSLIMDIIRGSLELFDSLLSRIFVVMYAINYGVPLDATKNYIRGIALGLVTVFVIKQAIDIYVFNVEGDPEADPLEIFSRVVQTVAIILCSDYIITLLVFYSALFYGEMTDTLINVDSDAFGNSMKIILDYTENILSGAKACIFVFMASIMHISFIIYTFKAAKRGGELILFNLILPFMALNLLTTSRERWNTFKNELGICVFGYIGQVFCLRVFLYLLALFAQDPSNLYNLIASISWIILSFNAPKWFQKLFNSSGVKNSYGGVRAVLYSIPYAIRK